MIDWNATVGGNWIGCLFSFSLLSYSITHSSIEGGVADLFFVFSSLIFLCVVIAVRIHQHHCTVSSVTEELI